MKRGLSGIVTLVIIILLVLAAVAIVWSAIGPTIRSGSGEVGIIGGFATNLEIPSESVNVDNTIGVVDLTVTRKAGGNDIAGFILVFRDESGNEESVRFNGSEYALDELESYTLVDYDFRTDTTLTEDLASIEVVPLLIVNGEERVGSVTDSWNSGIVVVIDGSSCGDADDVCNSGETQSCTTGGYGGEQTCNAQCTGFGGCMATEFCGDGVVNGNEACDDGDTDDGDGCSSTCQQEAAPLSVTIISPSTDSSINTGYVDVFVDLQLAVTGIPTSCSYSINSENPQTIDCAGEWIRISGSGSNDGQLIDQVIEVQATDGISTETASVTIAEVNYCLGNVFDEGSSQGAVNSPDQQVIFNQRAYPNNDPPVEACSWNWPQDYPNNFCTGDINLDGIVNGAAGGTDSDLAYVTGNWGPCLFYS